MDLKKTLGKRAPDGVYDIPLLGEVGYFGFQAEDLIRELMFVKPTQVRFVVYSPGGAVYDAIAVVGYLKANGIESFTEVYGYCASAATVFAAHSGPKRTAIAPGSMFLVHMPFHSEGSTNEADVKAIDNAVEFLSSLYMDAYGWTKAEVKKYMEANDGNGIPWTATEAKKLGIASEIMDVGKVAARYNLKPTAMAENKNTVKATVKLTLAQALASVAGGAEVEVEVEKATADAIAERDTRIAQLESELEAAKAAVPAEGSVVPAEQVTNATKKIEELEKAVSDKTKEVSAKADELSKAAAQIKELQSKIPAATPTVADNQDGTTGLQKTVDPPHVQALKNVMKGATPAKKQ